MPKHAVPVQMCPTDESFPAEIKESIRGSNVESVVFRDKTNKLNANCSIAYKKMMKTHNLLVMNFLFLINYA